MTSSVQRAAYEPLVRQIVAANPDTLFVCFPSLPTNCNTPKCTSRGKSIRRQLYKESFGEMHDVLYDRQKEWGDVKRTRDYSQLRNRALGLDMQKFSVDIDSSAIEDKIVAEYREGSQL